MVLKGAAAQHHHRDGAAVMGADPADPSRRRRVRGAARLAGRRARPPIRYTSTATRVLQGSLTGSCTATGHRAVCGDRRRNSSLVGGPDAHHRCADHAVRQAESSLRWPGVRARLGANYPPLAMTALGLARGGAGCDNPARVQNRRSATAGPSSACWAEPRRSSVPPGRTSTTRLTRLA